MAITAMQRPRIRLGRPFRPRVHLHLPLHVTTVRHQARVTAAGSRRHPCGLPHTAHTSPLLELERGESFLRDCGNS